jgi:hypothetical protein
MAVPAFHDSLQQTPATVFAPDVGDLICRLLLQRKSGRRNALRRTKASDRHAFHDTTLFTKEMFPFPPCYQSLLTKSTTHPHSSHLIPPGQRLRRRIDRLHALNSLKLNPTIPADHSQPRQTSTLLSLHHETNKSQVFLGNSSRTNYYGKC